MGMPFGLRIEDLNRINIELTLISIDFYRLHALFSKINKYPFWNEKRPTKIVNVKIAISKSIEYVHTTRNHIFTNQNSQTQLSFNIWWSQFVIVIISISNSFKSIIFNYWKPTSDSFFVFFLRKFVRTENYGLVQSNRWFVHKLMSNIALIWSLALLDNIVQQYQIEMNALGLLMHLHATKDRVRVCPIPSNHLM